MAEQSNKRRHAALFVRALRVARARRGVVGVILLLTLAVGALGALEPLLLKYFLDGLTEKVRIQTAALTLGMLALVNFAREAVSAHANWLTWQARLDFQYQLLDATVGRLHTLPLSYHRAHDVGGTMTRLDRGIQGMVNGLTELSFSVLPAAVYLVVAVLVMMRLDARATLLVLVFVPIPALVTALTVGEQVEREKELLGRWSSIYARFSEVLGGIVTVKSFVMEEQEKLRFLRGVSHANAAVVRGVFRDSWVGASKNLAIVVARLAALAWGGYWILRGEGSVGTTVAFLAYVSGLFGPFQGLLGTYQTLQKTSVSMESVFSILDAQDSLGDAPDAVELRALRGEVTFENVWFGYDRRRMVLCGVDVHVAPGEMVAIVGPSGSGKSTLMALLQRLYDPLRGTIRVDGHDLRTLRQRALRDQIGVVLQDGLILNDTVRANIAYGRPDATLEQVVEAARAAHAHEFVCALPHGYDTPVGERGSHLSVGQRQRLAIARALLKDPPILILDEATSALDAESEALVQEAFARLATGRTTFVVAHRLTTVMHADRILVVRDGRIAERGRHEELMAARGYYASLVERQLRGFAALRAQAGAE